MIEVAAAVIVNEQGRLLIARRKPGKAQGGLWEFPGGKLEPGESAEDCLRRELLEEMNIQIQPTERLGVHEHDYGTIVIRLIAYKAVYTGGDIVLSDHDKYDWVKPDEFAAYEFAPADIPFVKQLHVPGDT
ncbi:(deoxy)nucleoside triphosphate pyrophosphohydrolase [Paenibacillus pinihumi]|uniref:(deoxy)nucleoside triphosphate pyrophosphohydrolase n=1 Tax=Paenibacillus pinihumi TaxID=669462 RepID=UPI000412AC49|nr:(deoxy)nucleoside triphosphate pyrophosphohydrolase [Paenibacillus pinihumi]